MDQRRHTLLIVDDEVDVLESLRHLLHRRYRVLTASSAPEALGLLEAHDVHLILSDQRMPGMTGDEFLGRARRLYPDSIRMLFTGYADIQAVINAVNQGFIFRYIIKPWDAVELEGVIRQAAEQYDLLAERKRLIAELQAANAQLQEANRELAETSELKTAFMEVASHEFNTPITIVFGMSELLKLLNPVRDEQEREIIDRLSRSARHLADLVAHVLKMMRTDDFRRTLRLEPVDLAQLLRDVSDQLLPFTRSRSLHLELAIDDDLGSFEIDGHKVGDAVKNLLTNAIKFTPDGGRILLAASRGEDDGAVIEVADWGIGIEPRALARLFQPFFTEFDPSHHSSGDFGFNKRGLGLGLSIVKKFVELHGGAVSATSKLGEGTRFTIRLPRRVPRGHEHPPEHGAAAPPPSGLRAPVSAPDAD